MATIDVMISEEEIAKSRRISKANRKRLWRRTIISSRYT